MVMVVLEVAILANNQVNSGHVFYRFGWKTCYYDPDRLESQGKQSQELYYVTAE